MLADGQSLTLRYDVALAGRELSAGGCAELVAEMETGDLLGRAGSGGVTAEQAFPGATGVTLLDVYDWPTADGLRGGSAHIHLASTEGYVVLRGAGRLQTLGRRGFQETPLRPGDCLWFTPGTVHRLVNDDGQLQILVVMQNAGLPEAGDCVLTFPPEVLADPARYQAAATLSPAPDGAAAAGPDGPDDGPLAGVRPAPPGPGHRGVPGAA